MQSMAEYQSRMKRSTLAWARPPRIWSSRATAGKVSSGGITASGVGKSTTKRMVKSSCAASNGLRKPPVALTSQTSTQRSAQSVAKVSALPILLRGKRT